MKREDFLACENINAIIYADRDSFLVVDVFAYRSYIFIVAESKGSDQDYAVFIARDYITPVRFDTFMTVPKGDTYRGILRCEIDKILYGM